LVNAPVSTSVARERSAASAGANGDLIREGKHRDRFPQSMRKRDMKRFLVGSIVLLY
jgi:hypothetical protein